MTTHIHDAAPDGPFTDGPPPGRAPLIAARPRWLLPGIVGAFIVGGLVIAGAVPLSTVLYAGLFGGMILMHVGGHGHGGHGSTGHDLHSGHLSASKDANLSRRSSGAQDAEPAFAAGPGERAAVEATRSENDRHDQSNAHGCH